MKIPRIIAIDGPAASGKSTLAEKLADDLGYLYFDTGVMYRAVTLAALRNFSKVDEEKDVSELANEIKIDVQPPSKKMAGSMMFYWMARILPGKLEKQILIPTFLSSPHIEVSEMQ